jgi:hypothetical protein
VRTADFGLFSPTDGESYNPLLRSVNDLRDHVRCLLVVAFMLLDDPERLFTVAEASILTGYKPETIRRWAAGGRIESVWLEAIAEYRLTAASVRRIRDGGAGPEGEYQPAFVDAPPDAPARVRKVKRASAETGGGNGARA